MTVDLTNSIFHDEARLASIWKLCCGRMGKSARIAA